MKIVAIICEYNLFHNGHLYQIQKIKERYDDAVIVALMSGNFVQRGEPALIGKYERAAAAVKCGVDLVLELPFPYACASAEFFARGAVSLLNKLGGVELLCFGSESGDLANLMKIRDRIDSKNFTSALEQRIADERNTPVSFIKLKRELYLEMYGDELPEGANDTLGVEYLRAMNAVGADFSPFVIKREPGFTATETRTAYRKKQFFVLPTLMPNEAYNHIINAQNHADITRLESAILNFFRMAKPSSLSKYAEITDGLGHRLCECALSATTASEFFSMCATKKYTDAKIRRAVLSCMIGITKENLKEEPAFTYLLAANDNGTAVLRHFKKRKTAEIITKPAHAVRLPKAAAAQCALSERADRLYTLCMYPRMSADFFIKAAPTIFTEN